MTRRDGFALRMVPLACVVFVAVSGLVFGTGGCAEAKLSTIERGGSGPPTIVLLHGYGSRAEEWLPFTRTIRLPDSARFVFPRAPETTVPPDGPAGGRGWWRLGLGEHIPPGQSLPDLSATRPPGITYSARLVVDLIDRLRTPRDHAILLGGFSQGAMVASEVAFKSSAPLGALILLSGTAVDEAGWRARFADRRGMPIFIAHGRSDPTLPYAVAERMKDELVAAGLDVTWHPFDGGHEIPAEVVVALNTFLAEKLSR